MSLPALIDLSTANKLSKSQVGEQTLLLSKLLKRGIPVSQTVVIPQNTLELIVYKTNLAQQLKNTITSFSKNNINQSDFLKLVKHTIRHLHLPTDISKMILTWYHQNPGFLRVSAISDNIDQHSHDNVKGDANLIDSILAVWAEHIVVDFDNKQLQIFAPPILIQHQDQPEISGFAFTKSPDHKSQLQIFSNWGVYDPHHQEIALDGFNIDIRTGQIIQKQLHPQYLMLQRQTDALKEKTVLHYKQNQLSLNDEQVLELAHIIITLKRSLHGPHLVGWHYSQGQFFITEVLPIPESIINENNKKTLVSGDSFQTGISSGKIFVLTHKKQLPEIDHGQVVVTKELITDYLPALEKAAAIVCDRGLSIPMLANHIKKHSLPTILNTRHATKYLKAGLSVIVDANAGQVLSIPTSKTPLKSNISPLTITKVYISAGNPQKAQEYVSATVDGVGVLRSEYSFARFGDHPHRLSRSNKRSHLKEALKKTIQAYQKTKPNLPVIYRSQDFTSQELGSLNHATSFEPNEPNPYLGFRGGLRMISNFELLNLEIEAIKELLLISADPIGLMLPFIRTPSELRLITNHLEKNHQITTRANLKVYLQLNTPENILQLRHYLKPLIAGISVNARSIHALLHGVDPSNPDIFTLYPYDIELMRDLLEKTMHQVRALEGDGKTHQLRPKMMLHLEDYNLQLIEIATRLGFDAVIVKPEFSQRAKQCISELEEEKFNAV